MAGIYDDAISPSGARFGSCAIVTTQSDGILKKIHAIAPVIVKNKNFDLWLGAKDIGTEEFRDILAPVRGSWLKMYPVSLKVNKTDYDEPSCIAPIRNVDIDRRPLTQRSLLLSN